MIVPYSVDVPMDRWPISNWVLIVVTCLISFYAFGAMMGNEDLESWMMFGSGDWNTQLGLLGSVTTHADFMHLIGNMVFLFVFGNAVSAKLGHAMFLSLYFIIGAVSGLASSMLGDMPGLGASGAISGVTGMFIVLFPRNNVSVFYWLGLRFHGVWVVSSWVAIGFYFAKDILFYIIEQSSGASSGIGFVAHISGTLLGAALAATLLLTDRIRPSRGEQTLVDLWGKKA
jgi:membrane associated rhomboid family serine protease